MSTIDDIRKGSIVNPANVDTKIKDVPNLSIPSSTSPGAIADKTPNIVVNQAPKP